MRCCSGVERVGTAYDNDSLEEWTGFICLVKEICGPLNEIS